MVDAAALRWQNRQEQLAMERDMEDRMMRAEYVPPQRPEPVKTPEPVQHLTAAQRATKDWDDRLKKAIRKAIHDNNTELMEFLGDEIGKELDQLQKDLRELRIEVKALRAAKKRGWFR